MASPIYFVRPAGFEGTSPTPIIIHAEGFDNILLSLNILCFKILLSQQVLIC